MRLIDADALADNIAVLFERNQALINEWLMHHVEDAIDDAPTIEAEPVVRCKDCMYNKGKVNKKGFRICSANGMDITDDDYCSWGEKMDIGEEE